LILNGSGPESEDNRPESAGPDSGGGFSILGLFGYIVGSCILFVIFEKLGCHFRGLGQSRTWDEVWGRLPGILLFGAGSGAILYIMRWLRERKR
jgi:hypothetical protein